MIRYFAATIVAALLLVFALPAQAATFRTLGGISWDIDAGANLTLGGAPGGQQSTNNPCVICGANQPNQTNFDQNFGYTDYGNQGNQVSEAYFSSGILRDTVLGQDTISVTNYSGQQIINLITAMGGQQAFSIGIDVNDTNKPQTLESFFFLDLTSKTVVASFLPALADSVDLLAPSNGTGFPDFTLNGLTTAGLDPNHQYAFYARLSNTNDGPDSFFIVPQVAAVPIPAVGAGLPGLIAGMMGLVALQRRRRRRMAAQV